MVLDVKLIELWRDDADATNDLPLCWRSSAEAGLDGWPIYSGVAVSILPVLAQRIGVDVVGQYLLVTMSYFFSCCEVSVVRHVR